MEGKTKRTQALESDDSQPPPLRTSYALWADFLVSLSFCVFIREMRRIMPTSRGFCEDCMRSRKTKQSVQGLEPSRHSGQSSSNSISGCRKRRRRRLAVAAAIATLVVVAAAVVALD